MKLNLAALAGLMLLAAAPARAQDGGALLDLLVKKGIVSNQEAEDLRVQLMKDFTANTSAGKLNLSSAVSDFKLSGDMRIREVRVEDERPVETPERFFEAAHENQRDAPTAVGVGIVRLQRDRPVEVHECLGGTPLLQSKSAQQKRHRNVSGIESLGLNIQTFGSGKIARALEGKGLLKQRGQDRKSTRLNSSHT